MAKADEILRVKGLKGVTKREGRTASNGLVTAQAGAGEGTLVEVLCETDFVAKGERFGALADQVLTQAVATKCGRRRGAARVDARRRQVRQGAARRGQRHHRREDRGQARGPPRGRARRVLPAQDQPRPARADRCARGDRPVATSRRPATSRCTSPRSARACSPATRSTPRRSRTSVASPRPPRRRRASPRPPSPASSRVASTATSRRTSCSSSRSPRSRRRPWPRSSQEAGAEANGFVRFRVGELTSRRTTQHPGCRPLTRAGGIRACGAGQASSTPWPVTGGRSLHGKVIQRSVWRHT